MILGLLFVIILYLTFIMMIPVFLSVLASMAITRNVV